MKENNIIGSCGLGCVVCSAMKNKECEGCSEIKAEQCDIKKCCISKDIQGCFDCMDYPCEREMFKNERVCAFVEAAKDIGVKRLADCLIKNEENGIYYHPLDGSKGDYDVLDTKESIKALILKGEINE